MNNDKIILDYGSGGQRSHLLINKFIMPFFDNPILRKLNDSAILNLKNKKVAFSTDSYVIDPIFFSGGNIGDLAINGTINDISMSGAKPLYISVAFIIEEGFAFKDLEKILISMRDASKEANVLIVTGDTKVVQKGAADKIFINTSGIGVIEKDINISGDNAKVGDKIIVSGGIAEHGISILVQRENLDFNLKISSDSAALNFLVSDMLDASENINALRDPTRGGLGTTLNEIAISSNIGIKIYEDKLPIKEEVKGICEMLGFDPLYIANEGKLIAFVRPKDSDKVLSAMKKNKHGQDAAIIGEVIDDYKGKTILETKIGGERTIPMLEGEQLPRIC